MNVDRPDSVSEIYAFLNLLGRVAEGDGSLYRRIDDLAPDERLIVARETIAQMGSMELDETGRHLVRESIRRSLQRIGR